MLSLTIALSRLIAARREAAMREAVLGVIRSSLDDPLNGLAACRKSFSEVRAIKQLHLPPVASWSTLYAGPTAEVLLLPRPSLDLTGWISYLDSDIENDAAIEQVVKLKPGEDVMLLLEADEAADVDAFIKGHQQWWNDQEHAVKLESLCRRVAWRVGPPFAIVLACSLLDLERLIEAYLSDLLVTDDPLSINQILVVQTRGRPAPLIRTSSASSFGDRASPAARRAKRFLNAKMPPSGPSRPPNVVVFDASAPDRASGFLASLRAALDADSYVLHGLSAADFRSGAWRASTALLLCLCDRGAEEGVRAEAVRFAVKSGAACVLLLPPDEEMAEEEMENVEEGWTEVDAAGGGRLVCLRDPVGLTDPSRLNSLLASLDLRLRQSSESDSASDSGPAVLCAAGDDARESLREILSIFSSSRLLLDAKSPPAEGRRSLVTWDPTSDFRGVSAFDFEAFRDGLQECPVSISLIHADTLTSSWSIMEGIFGRFKPNSGIALSSFRQTEGKGRGKNAWISPPGQLQVTFHASTHVSSLLGQHPTLMQHLAAVSTMLAIEDALPGEHKDLGLRIKWPNDIYWRRSADDLVKLGGFLTKASLTKLDFHFIVGLGLNVNNARPTACLHQVLQENDLPLSSLPSIEVLQRNVLLRFFRLKNDLEHGCLSLDALRELYTARWLHSGQVVAVTQPDGSQLAGCRILGLDDFGYLWVQAAATGERFSIQPDGNSFDMMANLIKPK